MTHQTRSAREQNRNGDAETTNIFSDFPRRALRV